MSPRSPFSPCQVQAYELIAARMAAELPRIHADIVKGLQGALRAFAAAEARPGMFPFSASPPYGEALCAADLVVTFPEERRLTQRVCSLQVEMAGRKAASWDSLVPGCSLSSLPGAGSDRPPSSSTTHGGGGGGGAGGAGGQGSQTPHPQQQQPSAAHHHSGHNPFAATAD